MRDTPRDAPLQTTEVTPETIGRDVLDHLLEGCQVIGFDWTYLYVNGAASVHGNRPPEQLVGRTMMECYPGIEHTAMFERLQRAMTERTPDRMQNAFTYPDGQVGWFELRFQPVPQGVCILSLDITEIKRAEEAARQAKERLQLLIDGLRDHAIFIVDRAGRIIMWNRGAERLTGYQDEEIIGASSDVLRPAGDLAEGVGNTSLETAVARGRAEEEGWRVRKDGTRFWANVIISPLYDSAGAHIGFATIIRDLTERRKLEQQLQQAQKMEAVGQLAGGVAHDFNNILSVVLSYADLIVSDLNSEDPLCADVKEIRTAALRATDLTRQLLAFSRQQVLEAKTLDLNQTVAGTAKMLRRLLGADVELTLLPGPALWNIKADPGQVEQILMNLAINARDAMPGGGRLTIETANVELDEDYARSHHEVSPGEYVMLAVSDSGSGMNAQTQARVFEPFFTTKEKGKGTGLGLATVFGIVKQSGGHIWLYSEPDSGTTFRIYFPRAQGPAKIGSPEPPVPESERGTETILLVEDDDQVRTLARNILRRNGYVVLECSNGGEALLTCEQHGARIHLLLTDVVLPRMSGRQLAERLGPERPDMKVLFMSGYTNDSVFHHGLLDSGVAYLQKPLTPTSLARKVRAVLAGGAQKR